LPAAVDPEAPPPPRTPAQRAEDERRAWARIEELRAQQFAALERRDEARFRMWLAQGRADFLAFRIALRRDRVDMWRWCASFCNADRPWGRPLDFKPLPPLDFAPERPVHA
jgi:hypothetical protein